MCGCSNTFICDITCPLCGKEHKDYELQTKDFNYLKVYQQYFHINEDVRDEIGDFPKPDTIFRCLFVCDKWVKKNKHNENDAPFCGFHGDLLGIIHDYRFKGVMRDWHNSIGKKDYVPKPIVFENLHDSFVGLDGKDKK